MVIQKERWYLMAPGRDGQQILGELHQPYGIAIEIRQNIDRHSKKLIVANLELLLKYCSRFYERQFIACEHVNNSIVEQFKDQLNNYLMSDKIKTQGLPSVAYFADESHLAPNYFGDLIKRETDKTALEYIQLQLIDLAKERIFDTTLSVSENPYDPGIKYPQHLTRFFKQKRGIGMALMGTWTLIIALADLLIIT